VSMLLGLPAANTTTTETATAVVPATANGYIALPITIDPDQLVADAFGFIALQIPGWLPYEGQLEAWLIEACAQMVAAYAQTAALVPLAIFEYLGGALFNLPPNAGAPAETPTTWTMVDAQGYTVPAGTVVAAQTNGNTYVLFETTAAFTVPTGSTATAPGAVTVAAVEVGAINNGIGAGTMTLANSLAYVSAVTSTEVTSGGADAETTATYVSRLSNQLTLMTPRPVLASDFAALAVGQQGCARALGIDNFSALANMLTPPDDGTGTAGIGSWAAITNCSVVSSTGVLEASTTGSVTVTATASGPVVAATNLGHYAASPGNTYAAVIGERTAATTQSVSAVIRWKNAAGGLISTSAGTPATDSSSAFTLYTVSGLAPALTVSAEVGLSYSASAGSEVHYVGQRSLFYIPSGGSVPAWSAGGLQTGQERMVTVVPVDINGDALTPVAMAAIGAYLQTLREVNFVVNVAPPTYFPLAVVATVICNYGTNPNTVQASVSAALTEYLAQDDWAGGSNLPPIWLNDPTVRYLSVAALINAVAGVHHLSALTLNGSAADVTMTGYAPLPVPTVSVTVTVAPQNT
jgi:Baseplate J-like protein